MTLILFREENDLKNFYIFQLHCLKLYEIENFYRD